MIVSFWVPVVTSFWHVQVPARPKASDNRDMAGTQKYVKMLRIDLFVHYIIKKPLESHWNTHIWLMVLLLISDCDWYVGTGRGCKQ